MARIAKSPNQSERMSCLNLTGGKAKLGHANLLPVALAAERKTVILTNSHEFATARLA